MAVDTRDKRAAAVHFCAPFKSAKITPDGAISSQADRQQNAYTYPGILATGGGSFNVAWAANSTFIFNYSGVYS